MKKIGMVFTVLFFINMVVFAKNSKSIEQFELEKTNHGTIEDIRLNVQFPINPYNLVHIIKNNQNYYLRFNGKDSGIDFSIIQNKKKLRLIFGARFSENQEIAVENDQIKYVVWKYNNKYKVHIFRNKKKIPGSDSEYNLKKYVDYGEFGYTVSLKFIKKNPKLKPTEIVNGNVYSYENLKIFKTADELCYITTEWGGKLDDLTCIFDDNKLIYYYTKDEVYSELFGVDMRGQEIKVMFINGDMADIDVYDKDWNYLESRKQVPYIALKEKEEEIRKFLGTLRFRKGKKKK